MLRTRIGRPTAASLSDRIKAEGFPLKRISGRRFESVMYPRITIQPLKMKDCESLRWEIMVRGLFWDACRTLKDCQRLLMQAKKRDEIKLRKMVDAALPVLKHLEVSDAAGLHLNVSALVSKILNNSTHFDLGNCEDLNDKMVELVYKEINQQASQLEIATDLARSINELPIFND
jgi:hypothetical protein